MIKQFRPSLAELYHISEKQILKIIEDLPAMNCHLNIYTTIDVILTHLIV